MSADSPAAVSAAGVPMASWSMRSYDEQPWRPGRKVGRTIYAQQGQTASDEDVLIGVMDTEWYAEITCRDHNIALGFEGVAGVFPN